MSTITTLRELIGAMADYPHKTDMVRKWALEAIDIVATLQSERQVSVTESATPLREFAERCRPAARVWADRAERATRNPSLPAHYAPVLVAEADRARKLLDEIDALLAPAERTTP